MGLKDKASYDTLQAAGALPGTITRGHHTVQPSSLHSALLDRATGSSAIGLLPRNAPPHLPSPLEGWPRHFSSSPRHVK